MNEAARRVVRGTLLALLLLTPVLAEEGEEYRERRRAIEVETAEKLMEIAQEAKRLRGADLAREAFERAEELDPGNAIAIDFDPETTGSPSRSQERRLGKLEKRLASVKLAEARARLDLAVWCDEEALLDESVEEAATALTLVPGPVTFTAEGVLSAETLGTLPKALSLSLLDEHEVFEGRLVPLKDLPAEIPWSRGWKLVTKHFRIETNVSGRICRTLGRALEAAREIYREETGFDVRERIVVYVLAKRASYEEYWVRAGEPRPHPTNSGKCVRDTCAVDGSKSAREIVSVSIHEVAHGYFHLGHEAMTGKEGAAMPTWYAEGLATYCAGHGPGSYSYEDGLVLPRVARDGPLKRFQTFVRLRQGRPLAEFFAMEQLDSRFYYQACALFWFFHETEDEGLKARYATAVEAVKKAALAPESRTIEGTRVFLETLGIGIEELGERFFDWVAGLEFGAETD